MKDKLYFAHATKDYNTETEIKYLSWLEENYPEYEIINPKDIEIEKDDVKHLMGVYMEFIEMMDKYFIPVVLKCKLIVAFPYGKTNVMSAGVKYEYTVAMHNRIMTILYEDK